ncbi:30S ribosomal protein S9 [Patescibacteria group bacterium]|nr:30S ribosomal protein S9 [Patescibacteria group bacterium]
MPPKKKEKFIEAVGRRKTAVARIRIMDDAKGGFVVNDKPMDEYFNWMPWQKTVQEAFQVSDTLNRFRVVVRVAGGGINSQAQAIRHGIARALVVYDETLKAGLRSHGLITRDARIKESKKYGLKRARRAPQYTKR